VFAGTTRESCRLQMHRSKDIAADPAQPEIGRFALRIPTSIEPPWQKRYPKSFRSPEYDFGPRLALERRSEPVNRVKTRTPCFRVALGLLPRGDASSQMAKLYS
jgi:hypothetical protein